MLDDRGAVSAPQRVAAGGQAREAATDDDYVWLGHIRGAAKSVPAGTRGEEHEPRAARASGAAACNACTAGPSAIRLIASPSSGVRLAGFRTTPLPHIAVTVAPDAEEAAGPEVTLRAVGAVAVEQLDAT